MGTQSEREPRPPRSIRAISYGGPLLVASGEQVAARREREQQVDRLIRTVPSLSVPVNPDWEPTDPAPVPRIYEPPDPVIPQVVLDRDRLMFCRLHDGHLPLNPYRAPKRKGPRASRESFLCPPGLWNGCVPAMLASLYVNIPWSHHLTFSAAPGAFREAWNHTDILSRLEGQFGDRCVWLLVFAVQPGTGEPHAHVLLAGVTDRAVIRQMDRWRRLGFHGEISR